MLSSKHQAKIVSIYCFSFKAAPCKIFKIVLHPFYQKSRITSSLQFFLIFYALLKSGNNLSGATFLSLISWVPTSNVALFHSPDIIFWIARGTRPFWRATEFCLLSKINTHNLMKLLSNWSFIQNKININEVTKNNFENSLLNAKINQTKVIFVDEHKNAWMSIRPEYQVFETVSCPSLRNYYLNLSKTKQKKY